MPLYNYQCEQCQSEFTELRRCSEMDAAIECPECGNRETRRTLSCFAVGVETSSPTITSPKGNSPIH